MIATINVCILEFIWCIQQQLSSIVITHLNRKRRMASNDRTFKSVFSTSLICTPLIISDNVLTSLFSAGSFCILSKWFSLLSSFTSFRTEGTKTGCYIRALLSFKLNFRSVINNITLYSFFRQIWIILVRPIIISCILHIYITAKWLVPIDPWRAPKFVGCCNGKSIDLLIIFIIDWLIIIYEQ